MVWMFCVKEAKKKSQESVELETKVGRNDPCPCGSGKKYKNVTEKFKLKVKKEKTTIFD